MGPRHLCRGIQLYNMVKIEKILASMGPRHLCRGIRMRPLKQLRD
ncbi:MAG: hypothetical protein OJF51_000164 [Nitrospira sp.]|nr:MAG: hypothetical protein OJF51_000164 [Nitrospira sp.]